jgi:hypothetical protein
MGLRTFRNLIISDLSSFRPIFFHQTEFVGASGHNSKSLRSRATLSSLMAVAWHSPWKIWALTVISLPSLLPSPQLFPQILTVETFTVQLPEDDGNVAVSKRPPREFTIRIRKSGQLMTKEILAFLVDKPHDESMRFTGTLPYPSLFFHLAFSADIDSNPSA